VDTSKEYYDRSRATITRNITSSGGTDPEPKVRTKAQRKLEVSGRRRRRRRREQKGMSYQKRMKKRQ
jgi:hypothetical protein